MKKKNAILVSCFVVFNVDIKKAFGCTVIILYERAEQCVTLGY